MPCSTVTAVLSCRCWCRGQPATCLSGEELTGKLGFSSSLFTQLPPSVSFCGERTPGDACWKVCKAEATSPPSVITQSSEEIWHVPKAQRESSQIDLSLLHQIGQMTSSYYPKVPSDVRLWVTLKILRTRQILEGIILNQKPKSSIVKETCSVRPQ